MKNQYKIIFAILLVVVVGLLLWMPKSEFPPETVTPTPTSQQIISDGVITASFDSEKFGLATNPDQVLVKAYIPPCDQDFNYCLYYKGEEYTGTNFESAGLKIKNRTDLLGEPKCLETAPEGFDQKKTADLFHSDAEYSSSVFKNVGDAGAGHYASGSLYRLYVVGTPAHCYEFETRVGQTQFLNFPAGTIKEFTAANLQKVQADLEQILDAVALPSKKSNLFNF
ncbi:MAG: hypothetical protein V4467_05110 [Patescibacteria group bacterium]